MIKLHLEHDEALVLEEAVREAIRLNEEFSIRPMCRDTLLLKNVLRLLLCAMEDE